MAYQTRSCFFLILGLLNELPVKVWVDLRGIHNNNGATEIKK